MSDETQSWLSRLLGRFKSDAPESVSPCDDPEMAKHGNCEEVRANASDYVDGEMPASLTDRLKVHLGLCRDCDSWVKSFATTVGLMKDMPQEEAPDSLMQKIRQIPRSER